MSQLKINGVSIKKVPVELTQPSEKNRISGWVDLPTKQLYHDTVKNYSFNDIIRVGCQVLNYTQKKSVTPNKEATIERN